MHSKTNLKSLLAEGRTNRVIQALLDLTKHDGDLHNEAIQLSARFNQYNREKHGNTAPTEELNIELNRIHGAALDLIERLPDRNKKRVWWQDWRKLAAAIGSFIVFGAAVAEFTGYSLRDVLAPKEKPTPVDTSLVVTKPEQPPADTLSPADQRAIITEPEQPTPKPPPKQPVTKTEDSPATNTKLTITCKADKGTQNIYYRQGEIAHLYFKTNQPCYVRTLYRLADSVIILFDDDRQVTNGDVDRWLEISSGFAVAAPYGEEQLYVFAQNAPFPDLQTRPHPADPDYTIVTEGLPQTLRKTRGLKKIKRFAEAALIITTLK